MRAPSGRFAAPLSDRDLLHVVDEAMRSLAVDGELTQAAFDGCRAHIGYPDSPTAKQIADRLERRWRELCRWIAEAKDLDRLTLPGDARRANSRTAAFTNRHAFFAARIAARYLGRPPDDEAELGLALSRIAATKPELAELLPSLNQSIRLAGGRAKLLVMAGSSGWQRDDKNGVPLPIAISAYIDVTGRLPAIRRLEQFAKDRSFALASRRGTSWNAYLDQARKFREENGLPTPKDDHSAVPTDSARADRLLDRAPKTLRKWSVELVVAALAEYLDELDELGGTASQRDYRARQRNHASWPSSSTVERYGAFRDLLRKARNLRRTRATS